MLTLVILTLTPSIMATQDMEKYTFLKPIPMMRVKDVEASLKFYVDQVGFKTQGRQDGFASISLGEKAACNIYLFAAAEAKIVPSQTMIMIVPTKECNVDTLAARLQTQGVKLAEPVENKEWGYRQFKVTDPDGEQAKAWQLMIKK